MRSLSWLLALLLMSSPGLALASDVVSEAASPGTEEVAERWMRLARVPGAVVAHVRQGREPTVQPFGERAPGVPMTADARFNAASLTKPVFALTALHLVAEEAIALDAPLAAHWVDPDIAADDRHRAITLRLALSHQTGLPNWRQGQMTMAFAPGDRHEYSGEGYEYARRALEALTHRDLAALAHRHVLDRAGMTHTSFGWAEIHTDREVTGHDAAGRPVDMKLRDRRPNAAANLITTAGDYARFAKWILDGADLPDDLFTDMTEPQARHPDPAEVFGLGWKIARSPKGGVLWHDGRETGTRTVVYIAPKTGEALVVLTNGQHGELLFRPLLRASLTDGEAIANQISHDVWHYVKSLPAAQLGALQTGISRSPSFTSQLLYAVDTGVLAALLDVDHRDHRGRLHTAIDEFASAMIAGRLQPEDAHALIAMLIDTSGDAPRVRTDWSRKQAQAWADRLIGLAMGGHAPASPD